MSQLRDTFLRAVAAFNSCQNAGDYGAMVGPFLDPQVMMEEFDSPHNRHYGRDDSARYLDVTQPGFLPRFRPDQQNLVETPANSDSAVFAWISGPGQYQDRSTNPPSDWLPMHYFFQFKRTDTGADWLITFASASADNT